MQQALTRAVFSLCKTLECLEIDSKFAKYTWNATLVTYQLLCFAKPEVVQVSCLLPLPLCENPVGLLSVTLKAWGQSLLGLPPVTLKALGLLLGRFESKSCRFSSSPQSKILSWILDFERFSGNFLCVVSAGGLDFGYWHDIGFRIWILGLLVAILHVFFLIQYWIAAFLQFCNDFGR